MAARNSQNAAGYWGLPSRRYTCEPPPQHDVNPTRCAADEFKPSSDEEEDEESEEDDESDIDEEEEEDDDDEEAGGGLR